MSWFKWVAPAVATVAVFTLTALRGAAPMVQPVQWTIGQLAAETVHFAQPHQQPSGLRKLVEQVRQLRQEFGTPGKADPGWTAALTFAALIPAAALLAGLAALLSWLFTAWPRPRLYGINAGVGLVSSAYAIGASWWLTRMARQEVASALTRAQHSFGGLLGHVDWSGLQAGLLAPLGLDPQAGLYVLFLVFLAMLAYPFGGGFPSTASQTL